MPDDIRPFPARITARSMASEALRELIGSDLAGIEPYFFTAEISSDRLDAYFTHMAESTLRNFAQNALEGVAFLDSHNSRNLGYGQSLSGTFEINGDISRVVADFYTVPGIRFRNGVTYDSTDDFIRAVETRLVRDVSVGFYGGDMICDICGNSFWDWRNCDHWPGEEYAVGEQGEQTVIGTFTVENANLAEVSGVYDGATPQAQIIQRAQAMNQAGQLPPETARRLEVQYRIKLPAAPIVRGFSDNHQPNERRQEMPNETNLEDQVRALLGEANIEGEDVLEQLRALIAENARLAPLADQGRQYREDLIADALAQGVRAMGQQFPAETYENMFRNAPLDHIKQLRDAWAKQASERLAGGRKTQDGDESTPQPARLVPDHAYQS